MLLKGDSEITTLSVRYSTNIGELGGLVMKKFLLASVAVAAIAGPAMAADMPISTASSAGGLLRLDRRLYRL